MPETEPAETNEAKIARLESENAALVENETATPEAGSADAPEKERVSPLAALAASVSEAEKSGEHVSFVGHLEKLAEDGYKAAINPATEHDVIGVIAALVADIAKVKL